MTHDYNDDQRMTDWLFTTQALNVAPAEHPFWYTSGLLGPYYINTHYLCGGDKAAADLLLLIEDALESPSDGLLRLTRAIQTKLEISSIYQQVIERLTEAARSCSFDFISGGERRDLFFSLPVALRLNRPHLTILKNGTAWFQPAADQIALPADTANLAGQTTLHIADLVTEASSYLRAWLPAVRRLGLSMNDTLAVVDRGQGGFEALAAEQVRLRPLIEISPSFFLRACQAGLINQEQLDQIQAFGLNPLDYTRAYIRRHPDFLSQELAAGGRRWERAQRCLEILDLPTDGHTR